MLELRCKPASVSQACTASTGGIARRKLAQGRLKGEWRPCQWLQPRQGSPGVGVRSCQSYSQGEHEQRRLQGCT